MSEVSSVIFMRMCFVIFICFKVAQLVWRDARACFLMPVGIHCYSMLGSIALGIFVPAVTSITVTSMSFYQIYVFFSLRDTPSLSQHYGNVGAFL